MKSNIYTILVFSILTLLIGCGLLNREVNCSPNLDSRKDDFPDMSFKNKFDNLYSIVGVSYYGVSNPDSLNVFKYITVSIDIDLPYAEPTFLMEDQGYCYRLVKVDTSIRLSFESKYLLDTTSGISSDFISIGSKKFTPWSVAHRTLLRIVRKLAIMASFKI